MKPMTRIDQFLAKIAGENVVTPEPLTAPEILLDKIAGNAPMAIEGVIVHDETYDIDVKELNRTAAEITAAPFVFAKFPCSFFELSDNSEMIGLLVHVAEHILDFVAFDDRHVWIIKFAYGEETMKPRFNSLTTLVTRS